MPAAARIFEPADYSLAELAFMLDWLGKPPIAALHKGVPKHVNPVAIRACLGEIYEFAELEKHSGVPWAGVDALKDSIVRYLAWQERTMEIHRRGGPRHASMFSWDDRGKPYKFGVGADSAEKVRSEITPEGEHRTFTVNLLTPFGESAPSIAEVAPWLKLTDKNAKRQEPDKLIVEEHGDASQLICSVCRKTIEFKTDSQRSLSMARAQMARHLRGANRMIERHQLLLRKEYK